MAETIKILSTSVNLKAAVFFAQPRKILGLSFVITRKSLAFVREFREILFKELPI